MSCSTLHVHRSCSLSGQGLRSVPSPSLQISSTQKLTTLQCSTTANKHRGGLARVFRHLMIAAASDSKFPTPLTPCLHTVPARLRAVTVQSCCHLLVAQSAKAHTSLPSVVCRARTWATHAAAGRSGHRRPPPPLRNSCQQRPPTHRNPCSLGRPRGRSLRPGMAPRILPSRT